MTAPLGTPDETTVVARLNALLVREGLPALSTEIGGCFGSYLSLLVRWNGRTSLTAIRDEEEIISRHFLESIACAAAVPEGVRTLLDFGSGAGFPGIPIALCRPEISVTLAESQSKKASFLREVIRTIGVNAAVHGHRAENLTAGFDCVVLRAVDRMQTAVLAASHLVSRGGWLLTMTTTSALSSVQKAAGGRVTWRTNVNLPLSIDRIIIVGQSDGC
jgi:16S rRNA (guanine527-N7)-methyltransferase